MRCIVSGCKNRVERNTSGISIHRFPKNEDLKMLWIQALGFRNYKTYGGVCSNHFLSSDFIKTTKKTYLKKEAVPCRNLFPTSESGVDCNNDELVIQKKNEKMQPNTSFRSSYNFVTNLQNVYHQRRSFVTENVQQQQQQNQSKNSEQNTTENVNKQNGQNTEIENLTKEIQELKEKNLELLDKYKRALADGENLRIRLTKQIEDAKIFGIQSFCKDLLEVADILGHATDAVPKDQLNDQNPHLKSLYEGLTMTKASLMQVFKRHGLIPVNPLNEKFDPNFHEALFQKEAKDVEPNTVVEVNKIGYKLHERCIRPALVGVSKST